MSSYKHYVIQQGETIQTIAFKLYQDVDQWHALANLNNLEYPYIVDSPQDKLNNPEHLLTRGDIMLLPNDEDTWKLAQDNKIVESNTKYYQPAYYDTVLGTDLALDVNTDGHMNESFGALTADKQTLKTVTGLDNLKQSLFMRILTRKGTLLFHPNYGSLLPDMLGKPMSGRLLADACNELQRTLETDTRVKQVKITNKLLDYNAIFINAQIMPIGEKEAFSIYLYQSQEGQVSIR